MVILRGRVLAEMLTRRRAGTLDPTAENFLRTKKMVTVGVVPGSSWAGERLLGAASLPTVGLLS